MNNEQATSQTNAAKLDRLLQLIEGETDAPGILARLTLLETVMFGRHGRDGLATKVNFMWRFYIWVLCSMSAGIGFLFRELLLKVKL